MFLAATMATLAVLLIYTGIAKAAGRNTAFSPAMIVIIAGLSLAGGWIIWLAKPAVGWRFPGIWVWLVCTMTTGALINYREKSDLVLFLPLAAVGVIAAVAGIGSSTMLRAGSYRKLLEEHIVKTESLDFTMDVEPVDLDNLRVVDQDLARQRGGTLIESIPGLGSQVELGPMSIQNLNGDFSVTTGNGQTEHLSFRNELVWAGILYPSGRLKSRLLPDT